MKSRLKHLRIAPLMIAATVFGAVAAPVAHADEIPTCATTPATTTMTEYTTVSQNVALCSDVEDGTALTYTISVGDTPLPYMGAATLTPAGALTYTSTQAAPGFGLANYDFLWVKATDTYGNWVMFMVRYEIYEAAAGAPSKPAAPAATPVAPAAPAAPAPTPTVDATTVTAGGQTGPSAIQLAPVTARGAVRRCGSTARVACAWLMNRDFLFRVKVVGGTMAGKPVQVAVYRGGVAKGKALLVQRLTMGANSHGMKLRGANLARGVYTVKVTIPGKPLVSNLVRLKI